MSAAAEAQAAAIRRYFAWLVRDGALPVDPTVGLTAPSGARRLPRVLNADQITILLEESSAADEHEAGRARLPRPRASSLCRRTRSWFVRWKRADSAAPRSAPGTWPSAAP
mgnify:CR=1 FL=1